MTKVAQFTCGHCGRAFEDRASVHRRFCSLTCSGAKRSAAHLDADHFWSFVRKSDGCWEWQAHHTPDGYGRIRVNRGAIRAHRYAWMLTRGEIPRDALVLHHCDNRLCVRPDHLYLGDHADNAVDRKARNRSARPSGESNPRAKLTEAQVIEIRELAAQGLPHTSIARSFNVGSPTIDKIVHRQRWAHIGEPVRG